MTTEIYSEIIKKKFEWLSNEHGLSYLKHPEQFKPFSFCYSELYSVSLRNDRSGWDLKTKVENFPAWIKVTSEQIPLFHYKTTDLKRKFAKKILSIFGSRFGSRLNCKTCLN